VLATVRAEGVVSVELVRLIVGLLHSLVSFGLAYRRVQ